MQPSPSTPISPSVPVVYPQSNAQTEVELVSPDALSDAETIASKMLEAQVCVTLAIPTGIFLLFFGLYLLIVEFYMNNAVDMSSFENGIFFLLISLVILAGGYGTRISEYTKSIPKPMISLNGKPIIYYIMKHFFNYGCTTPQNKTYFLTTGGQVCISSKTP